MSPVQAAVASVPPASQGLVDWVTLGTFVLAVGTLALVWFLFPGAKGVVRGTDERVSTSKFQATMWTFAVLFALLSLFYGFVVVRLCGDLLGWGWAESLHEPLSKGFEAFLEQGLDQTYLLLLGIPLAGAVVSKAITTSKVADGSVVKTQKSDSGTTATSGLQELVGDDAGDLDLGDLQYLLFNLLAVGYFLVQFMASPTKALPTMPDTLVGLTGVAAAAYIGKKGVYREPPILLGVLPPSGKPGETVQIYGEKLTSSTAQVATGGGAAQEAENLMLGVVVTFNGLAAELVANPTDAKVSVEVPDIAAGPVKVAVLRPPGASSEELPFTVLAR